MSRKGKWGWFDTIHPLLYIILAHAHVSFPSRSLPPAPVSHRPRAILQWTLASCAPPAEMSTSNYSEPWAGYLVQAQSQLSSASIPRLLLLLVVNIPIIAVALNVLYQFVSVGDSADRTSASSC